MESIEVPSLNFQENDQHCYVYFQNFHIFLFMRKNNELSFLFRKKSKTGEFIEFKGKLNKFDDAQIIFACGRKLFKKTAGLLTNTNINFFLENDSQELLNDNNVHCDIQIQQVNKIL